MNYRIILIAAVFHFVHQVEKDSLKHRHGEQFRTTWRPRMRNALLFGFNFQNAVNEIAKKCMKICLTLLKTVL